jgi:hypothetical protein
LRIPEISITIEMPAGSVVSGACIKIEAIKEKINVCIITVQINEEYRQVFTFDAQ